jgi:HlyD family secretion protein
MGVVKRGDIVQRATIAGTTIPNRKTIIAAPYNGYVRKIYVHIGDKVKAGDPIVSIAQSLRGSGEDPYPLRAPFAGTVVQVLKTEGEYVEQGTGATGSSALVRIDDLSQIFVDASCPELEVEKLKIDQPAVIKASAILDHNYEGKIEDISLAAKEQKDWDKSRVEFPVTIRVTNQDASIMPGMSVIVDVIAKELKNVLILGHEFVFKEGDKYFVTTEKGVKKEVQVGLQDDDAVEIKSGLKEGEKIRQIDYLSLNKDD